MRLLRQIVLGSAVVFVALVSARAQSPKYASCDIAEGYKTYYESRGIHLDASAYSCDPDDDFTRAQKALIYHFLSCDKALKQMQTDIANKEFRWEEDAYSCPPKYQLSADEKLAALQSALAPIASSSDWVLVGTGSDRVMYYLPKNTKQRSPGVMSAWFFTSFTSGGSQMGQYSFNCSAESLATNQEISYSGFDGTGSARTSLSEPLASLKYQEIVPRSLGESMLRFACKAKQQSVR